MNPGDEVNWDGDWPVPYVLTLAAEALFTREHLAGDGLAGNAGAGQEAG